MLPGIANDGSESMGQWVKRADTKPPIWDYVVRSGKVIASRNTEPKPVNEKWTFCRLCGQNTNGTGDHDNVGACLHKIGGELISLNDKLDDATILLQENNKQIGMATCNECEWFVVSSKKNAQSIGEEHSRQTGHVLEMLGLGLRWKIKKTKDGPIR